MGKDGKMDWNSMRSQSMIWLRSTFPLIFTSDIKPLKIGITKDIVALNIEGAPEKAWVSRAIGYYVRSTSYLRCMKAGAERFDLRGLASGTVTEQEAMIAKEALNQYQKKIAEKARQVKLDRNKLDEKTDKEVAPMVALMSSLSKNTGVKKILTLTKKRQSVPQVNVE